jgi:hypothetical protein
MSYARLLHDLNDVNGAEIGVTIGSDAARRGEPGRNSHQCVAVIPDEIRQPFQATANVARMIASLLSLM